MGRRDYSDSFRDYRNKRQHKRPFHGTVVCHVDQKQQKNNNNNNNNKKRKEAKKKKGT